MLDNVILKNLDCFEDDRGFYNNLTLDSNHLSFNEKILEQKISYSKAGTFRGLHLQEEPFSQGKIVQVLSGSIIDVIFDPIDLSLTKILMNSIKQIVYIPPGYAHGFFCLEDSVILYHVLQNYYNPKSEKSYNIYSPLFSKDLDFLKDIKFISEKDLKGVMVDASINNR